MLSVPEVPDPPFTSGAPYWYFLGGRTSLDLVNTRRERWRRRVETLVDTDDLGEWLVRAELLPAAPGHIPDTVLREARVLREAIDSLVVAVVEGLPPDGQAITHVDHYLVHAGPRPQLRPDLTLGERPAADSPRRALGMIALDAARMLGDPRERARIRICGSATCSARFFDRSPAGRRRWCSMELCGNVEKARRHRARQRASA